VYDIDSRIREAIEPLIRRITELENEVATLEKCAPTHYLTRKQLARELSCSERFIQDNPELKSLEHRIGGRVYYLRDEIHITIRNTVNR